MTRIKIVGLCGSFTPHASATAALATVMAGVRDIEPHTAIDTEIFEVRDLALPLYEWGTEPPGLAPWLEAVRSAHGLVWCSPLYHGSIAGAFKNTLDWLEALRLDDPPYLSGKVVALVATAGGDQALQAINTMEFIVRSLRGWTLPLTGPISRAEAVFDKSGQPRDEAVGDRLRLIGQELVTAARSLNR